MTVNVVQISTTDVSPTVDVEAVLLENAKLRKQLRTTQSKYRATVAALHQSQQNESRLQEDINRLQQNYQVATKLRDQMAMTFAETEVYWTSQMQDMSARAKQLLKIIDDNKAEITTLKKCLHESHLKWMETDTRVQDEIIAITLGVQDRLRHTRSQALHDLTTMKSQILRDKNKLLLGAMNAHSEHLQLAQQFEDKSERLMDLIEDAYTDLVFICEKRGVDPLTQGLLSCTLRGLNEELDRKKPDSLKDIQFRMMRTQAAEQRHIDALRKQLGLPARDFSKKPLLTAMTREEFFTMVTGRYKDMFQIDLRLGQKMDVFQGISC